MYLSRVQLNTGKRSTKLALASPARIHGAVENCFTDREERKLWRVDRLGGDEYLLILSPEKPCLSGLKEQFGFPGTPDEIRSYDEFLDRIEEGSVWQFRLAANPVHAVKKEGEAREDRGKVMAHATERYQLEWLEGRALKNGFSIDRDSTLVVSSEWKVFYRKGSTARVTLRETVFQGLLRVEDPPLFRNALTCGIGRGKAYGMGLLTVMRV